MYIGRRSMVAGNICVVKIPVILASFPINLKRDNAYPAVEARTTPVKVTIADTRAEFQTHSIKGLFVKSSTYCLNVAFAGIIERSVERSLLLGRIEIVKTFMIG
jgi:hypothetical protein